MIQKMEASLKQREQQLDRLMERLQKHVITISQFCLNVYQSILIFVVA